MGAMRTIKTQPSRRLARRLLRRKIACCYHILDLGGSQAPTEARKAGSVKANQPNAVHAQQKRRPWSIGESSSARVARERLQISLFYHTQIFRYLMRQK